MLQVKAVIKKLKREKGLDLQYCSDAKTVHALIDHYSDVDSVLFYQPYKPATSRTSEEPVIIMLSTPFQRRMLDQFGRRLVFLDATGGTNKYGYMFFTLLVQDDFGRGVPVSFMISSSEDADVVQMFLEKAADGVRMLDMQVYVEMLALPLMCTANSV